MPQVKHEASAQPPLPGKVAKPQRKARLEALPALRFLAELQVLLNTECSQEDCKRRSWKASDSVVAPAACVRSPDHRLSLLPEHPGPTTQPVQRVGSLPTDVLLPSQWYACRTVRPMISLLECCCGFSHVTIWPARRD